MVDMTARTIMEATVAVAVRAKNILDAHLPLNLNIGNRDDLARPVGGET